VTPQSSRLTPESLKIGILGSREQLSQVLQVLHYNGMTYFGHPKLGVEALLGDKILHLHLQVLQR
jgi:hypothetical protein